MATDKIIKKGFPNSQSSSLIECTDLISFVVGVSSDMIVNQRYQRNVSMHRYNSCNRTISLGT